MPPPRPASMRGVAFRLAAILLGVVVAVVIGETALRVIYPDSRIPAAHRQNVSPGALALFKADPEAGYLIAPGEGEYGPEGCLRNGYDIARPRGTRVLFIGDSVTHRGKVIAALRRLYGEEDYEYWNAGVESFNTTQELVLYRRHNATIRPDHVVLGFHNNDFNSTPLVIHERGEMRIFQQGPHINAWLFEKSYLYRWAWPRSERRDRRARAEEIGGSLRALRDLVAQDGARFSVVLFPVLKPYGAWGDEERWSREQSLALFKTLNLRVFDLLAPLEAALASGVAAGETPADTWHPGDDMAARFAQALTQERILEH